MHRVISYNEFLVEDVKRSDDTILEKVSVSKLGKIVRDLAFRI